MHPLPEKKFDIAVGMLAIIVKAKLTKAGTAKSYSFH